jgi:tetratricopeptide (TPR) repeat protein
LGLLLHRVNRKAEAATTYQKSLIAYRQTISELESHAVDWKNRLPDDAAQAHLRASIFAINQAEVLNAWGILLASDGKAKEAREKYRRALDLNPDLCAARDNWAQFEQTVEERKKGSVPGMALSLLDVNLARPACADFHPSLLRRAALRWKAGDLDGARQDFTRVHEKVSTNTAALIGIAKIDSANGDFKAAIDRLHEVIAIQTHSGSLAYPDTYLQLADVQRQANDTSGCLESYSKALKAASGTNYSVSKRQVHKQALQCGSPKH